MFILDYSNIVKHELQIEVYTVYCKDIKQMYQSLLQTVIANG